MSPFSKPGWFIQNDTRVLISDFTRFIDVYKAEYL